MSASKIGYLGTPGTYSEAAAMKMHSGEFTGFRTIPDLFNAVIAGTVDISVVPIENSVEGSVGITSDLLFRNDVYITGETYLKISHCLISSDEMTTDRVKIILSHPQALGQCARFISKGSYEVIPFPDTVTAVVGVRDRIYPNAAAIASERAAEIHGMKILERNIGDFDENYTRFVSLSSKENTSGKVLGSKTSIVVSVDNKPGSLLKALEVFYRYGINISKIESRPVRFTPWNYIFFLDFGTIEDQDAAMDELRKKVLSYKLLGKYPSNQP